MNFKKVNIRYDASDMSKAYLFSSDDEFISTIDPSPTGEKTKFAQTEEGKRNLKSHCEQKKELMEGIKQDLEHYKKVHAEFEESKIPKEVLSTYDEKDLIDQANLDYFLETTREVDRATEVKRKKKKKSKDREPTKTRVPASLSANATQNAKNYR